MIGNRIEYDGRTFNHADIKAGNLYQARALLSDSLEIDTFEVTLSSDANLTQFIRNAPLAYFYNDSQVGTYYVQNVRRIAVNKYQFSCTSTVGLLEQTDHNGGIYAGQTVQEVVADICGQYPVKVKTNLQGIALYGWLPIASRRDNLSQVLFAIGATLKVDYDGALRVEGLWGDQSANIDEDHMFDKGQVDYGTPVTQVVVTEHQYTQGDEQVTLFEGTTADGDKITFSEPHYNLSATGFTIREQGANYAIVTSGNGTLTGYKYVHSTRTVTKQVTTADSENAVKVENATLVSLANANAVAERLAAYYAHTERVTNDMVLQSESPGDVASLVHPYGGNVQACIESSDINLSGKLRSTEKLLVGYVPPDVGEAEYYDTVEIITEDGVWTAPEGVESVRAVLIGGGSGGDCGGKGADTAAVFMASVPNPGALAPANWSGYALAEGGRGGSGGEGGESAKVLQLSLGVQAGDVFDVQIGQGGSGAPYVEGGSQPAAGVPTIFGAHTSDDGSRADGGYTDPFTGEVYAGKGLAGIDGGKGAGAAHDTNSTTMKNALEFIGAESVVDEDGINWAGGTTPLDNGQNVVARTATAVGSKDANLAHGYVSSVGGGSLGGGAAAGGVPSNGVDAGYASASGSGTPTLRASARGSAGRKGADATKVPRKPTRPGRGGRGGYGGGGAGSPGISMIGKRYGSAVTTISGTPQQPTGGAGGLGCDGGEGADGCIIIYYRMPKPVQRGAVKDKNGRLIRDKYSRQLVV